MENLHIVDLQLFQAELNGYMVAVSYRRQSRPVMIMVGMSVLTRKQMKRRLDIVAPGERGLFFFPNYLTAFCHHAYIIIVGKCPLQENSAHKKKIHFY